MEDPFEFDVPSFTELAECHADDDSQAYDNWFQTAHDERKRTGKMARLSDPGTEIETEHDCPAQRTGHNMRDRISSPKKKRKMLTGPAKSAVQQKKGKTTEELELEKADKMREKVAASRKKNQQSYKVALSSEPIVGKKSSKPATVPESFHFQSDKRIRGMPECVPNKPKAQNNSSKLTIGKSKTTTHLTCPQPFHLSETKKKSTASTEGQYESVAEKIYQYQKRTPDRFKSKVEVPKGKSKSVSHLTVAKTPQLSTKERSRPPTRTLTRAEVEEQEFIEESKKQFKAHAVNQKILSVPHVGVSKVAPKPPTVPEEFHFHKPGPSHIQPEEEEKVETFHATQLNPKIFQGPIGVKPVKRAPLTIPQSPAFNTRQRVKQIICEPPQEVAPAPRKHHHVPHVGVPFRPKLERTRTVPQPFAVEERSKQMLKHKEEKIAAILEEERKAREFVAHSLPSDSPDLLPPKQTKPVTAPEPFHLSVDDRGQKYQEMRKKQLEEENQQIKAKAIFKARPKRDLKIPFRPERSEKPLTEFDNFTLNTDVRATERAQFDQYLKEHEAQVAALVRRVNETKQQEEAAAVAMLRHEMVHRAKGIARYSPMCVVPCTKPLTVPQTPNLRTKRIRQRHEEENSH